MQSMAASYRCVSAECHHRLSELRRANHTATSRPYRAALILHGLSASRSQVGYQTVFDTESFATLRANWIESNPEYAFDVYLHSWSSDAEAEVVRVAGAKRHLFEPAKAAHEFPDSLAALDVEALQASKPLTRRPGPDKRPVSPAQALHGLYSRFHSLSRAVALVGAELDSYDAVLLSRFDLVVRTPLRLPSLELRGNAIYSPQFSLQPQLSTRAIHCNDPKPGACGAVLDGVWLPLETFDPSLFRQGVMDYFFVATPEAARRMATLIDALPSYLSVGSPYMTDWRWPVRLTGHGLCAYHFVQAELQPRLLPLQEGDDFALVRQARCVVATEGPRKGQCLLGQQQSVEPT